MVKNPDVARVKRWSIILAAYAGVMWGTFLVGRVFILKNNLDMRFALGTFLISIIISVIICIFGLLNLKIAFISSSLGLVIGLSVMLSTYSNKTGWEDLVGPIAMVQVVIMGIALGLVAEGAAFIIRKIKRSS